MADNTLLIIVVIILAVVAFFLFSGDSNVLDTGPGNEIIGDMQTTQGTLQRTVPVESDGSFQVKYSTEETGDWAIIIEDTVSDNCQFSNGGQNYRSVMLHTAGSEQFTEVTGTNCEFSGVYYFAHKDNSKSEENKLIGGQLVK